MNNQLLWFTARGAGVVSLILLTLVVVLGLAGVARWQRPGWPRFLTTELHNNLALLSVVFVAIHVAAAIFDPFAQLGIAAATVPFASSYRPLWVALGVISVYLFLAMLITSELRERFGQRTWRAVHWLAYAGWPLAVAHGLGAGSDAFSWWLLPIQVGCVAAVLVALAWRSWVARTRRDRLTETLAALPGVPTPYAEHD
jgi:sulfoxide reductase heme-binding subunit YedZ